MRKKFNREAKDLLNSNIPDTSKFIVDEKRIGKLPVLMQRYLEKTGMMGRDNINTVWLKQKGFLRTSPDRKWFPMTAEQYYHIPAGGFIWYGKMQMMPLITLTGVDKFIRGKGSLDIRLLSLLRVAQATGPEADQGELMRYLSEMIWFPAAFLDDRISWEESDRLIVKASIILGGTKAEGMFHFDENGLIRNFTGTRYRGGKNSVLDSWSTPISEYGKIGDYYLPVKGEATWNLKEGDYSYINLEITDIQYNI